MIRSAWFCLRRAHFDNENAGTLKAVTAAGLSLAGLASGNYQLSTTTATATATIAARPLTVTATPNTKTYDGTTAAGAAPTIASGTLVPGDTAAWTESYDNRNAGVGKTLIPAGAVNDGNGGGNYAVSFVNDTDGVVNALPITVTATPNAKTYDGTTAAGAAPTITAGSLAPGDTAAWTESYEAKDVGTGRTLTPAGAVSDGNGGDNYAVSFIDNTDGVITQAGAAADVSSDNPLPVFDQPVTFTATVTPANGGLATGTVRFQIDGAEVDSPLLPNGTATYTVSTLVVGNHSIVAIYSGDGNLTGSTSQQFIQKVGQATPAITWDAPAPITYGAAVSAAQLDAAAAVDGTFTYTPALGSVLHAGAQTLSATFAPADTTDYTTATANVTLVVDKAVLTVNADGKTRGYGTANPPLTYSVSGYVNGDVAAAVAARRAFPPPPFRRALPMSIRLSLTLTRWRPMITPSTWSPAA